MYLKRLKIALTALIVVLVGFGIWSVASSLVGLGTASEDVFRDTGMDIKKIEELEDVGDRQSVNTARGERLEQTGTYEDKAVQCVYDFFTYDLPSEDVLACGYELKDVGDGNYCVKVGDWYVFVKAEYDVCYPYRFSKTTELSENEMKFVMDNNLELTESEGVYSWEN